MLSLSRYSEPYRLSSYEAYVHIEANTWGPPEPGYYGIDYFDNFVLVAYSAPALNGTLTVDSTPISAECFVNGTRWGFTPQTRSVTIGIYEVTWADVEGYYTPEPQIITINENETVVASGVYEEIPPPLKTFKLRVWSQPVQGISVKISNETRVFSIRTGESLYLTEGFYNITITTNVKITFEIWAFDGWSDGLKESSREVYLGKDTILLYSYTR